MKPLTILGILLALATSSCQEYETSLSMERQHRARGTESDTVSGGISFDFGDTAMTEEIDSIVITPEDWEDAPMDVDL